jgi:hypothetical protein
MHRLHEHVYRAALRLEHGLGHVAEILTVCLERQRTVTCTSIRTVSRTACTDAGSFFPLTKPGQKDS